MDSDREGHREAIESEVGRFMTEFARYLVAAGITNRRFSAICRVAFFRAAMPTARFANQKVNQSAIAAMTGLTRTQVRSFAKQTKPKPANVRERLDYLVEAWSTDLGYASTSFVPKRLRIAGSGQTFATLAKKYGGDIPARSILRELQRHGYVSIRAGQVGLKRGIARTRAEARLQVISKAMRELIGSAESNTSSASGTKSVNLEATFPASLGKGRLLFNRRAAEGLSVFIAALREMGSASAAQGKARQRPLKNTRARIVLVTEDIDSEHCEKKRERRINEKKS